MLELHFENYPEALHHLQLAVKFDPSDVIGSHGRLASLTHFLSNVSSGVQNAGGLRAKRVAEFKTSLPASSSSVNPFTDHRTVSVFEEISAGHNDGIAVVAKVVSTIVHDEGVPVASIIMDSAGECIALCVYNCAPSFSFFIGDTVAIADPHVVEVKDLELTPSSKVSFRSIRVPNPSKVSRNGTLPKPAQVAPSHLKISAL
ncbi:unnamed protein product [Strongylus vulgaris]|uniref:Tetratricopeptide repeat protein 5 OB fold domain-containing protein n=1 Tax=Strongylus vulgaris TaxID=40348 RepID=A0A3P7KN28_STRVU|nr:unnamed protein product [Strongylus vulgaris]